MFLEGELHINHRNSTTLLEPSPLGYIKLSRSRLSKGLNVRTGTGKVGIVRRPVGGAWSVFLSDELQTFCEKDLKHSSADYQVFLVRGVSFPLGQCLYPSGHSHALIFDPDYGRARSLTMSDARPLQGGPLNTFPNYNTTVRESALQASTPVAIQLYMDGLGLCSLVSFPAESTRAGGSHNNNCLMPPCVFL